MIRLFANGLLDRGSIPGPVIPKIRKMILGASLLNTQHYIVGIKGKSNNLGKGVVPFLTPRCSSY